MFHKSFNESGCWCCKDCEKHQINEKHGYVIPCNAKMACQSFVQHLEDSKRANREQSKDAREAAYEYARTHRLAKRK